MKDALKGLFGSKKALAGMAGAATTALLLLAQKHGYGLDPDATKLLVAAVKLGMGREQAHELIKGHAVAAALGLRQQADADNQMLKALAEDPDFPLGEVAIEELLESRLDFVGRAPEQVAAIADRVSEIVAASPEAAAYSPEPML